MALNLQIAGEATTMKLFKVEIQGVHKLTDQRVELDYIVPALNVDEARDKVQQNADLSGVDVGCWITTEEAGEIFCTRAFIK